MPNESTSSTSFTSEPYAVLTTLGSLPSEHGVRSVHSPAPAHCLGVLEYGLEHVPDQLLREIHWRSDLMGAKPSLVLVEGQAGRGSQCGSSSSDSTS